MKTKLCQRCGERPVSGWRRGSPGKYATLCEPCQYEARRKKGCYKPTPQIDRIICEVWREKKYQSRVAAPMYRRVQLRAGIDWPKWAIQKRAVYLGVTRKYVEDRNWSARELALLKAHAWRHPHWIQQYLKKHGFTRSLTAVVLKRKRSMLLGNRVFYSATALAGLLGIEQHQVRAWIEWGWLKAAKRETERTEKQGGDMFAIMPADARAFIVAHPEQVDLAKVDAAWFLELITKGEIQMLDPQWRAA